MSYISIYGSHDASICFSPETNKYRIYELERLTKERFFSLADVNDEEFIKLINQVKWLIEKEYGPQQYEACYYNEVSLSHLRLLSSIFNVTTFMKVGHHFAHAANALYQSPFNRSIIFSFDGGGVDAAHVSTSNIYVGDKTTNRILKIAEFNVDFGNSYALLAYPVSEIKKQNFNNSFLTYPGKLMGLSSYGQIRPEWVNALTTFYINQRYDGSTNDLRVLAKNMGQDLQNDAFSESNSFDFIKTSQYVFECLAYYMLRPFIDKYKLPVCLTGGCALNVLFNQFLKDKGIATFVPPNPSDCGLSLGQLLLVKPPSRQICSAYEGVDIIDIDKFEWYVEEYNAPIIAPKEIAALLKTKKIIAIMQGNSECGPRSLGNRSIICDPSFKDMKDILNQKVKFREWFRPFAPFVREEDVSKYFHFSGSSPFMSYAPKIKEEWKSLVPSIVHVDGTCRIQTVTESSHKLFYDILTELDKQNSPGILLNTSFNIRGKPILTSIEDALDVLNNTELDHVIIEGHLFSKKAKI